MIRVDISRTTRVRTHSGHTRCELIGPTYACVVTHAAVVHVCLEIDVRTLDVVTNRRPLHNRTAVSGAVVVIIAAVRRIRLTPLRRLITCEDTVANVSAQGRFALLIPELGTVNIHRCDTATLSTTTTCSTRVVVELHEASTHCFIAVTGDARLRCLALNGTRRSSAAAIDAALWAVAVNTVVTIGCC